ncbi:MAG: PAS-domain containing protein [Leptothrix sp. (in: b-proteobacteria)]
MSAATPDLAGPGPQRFDTLQAGLDLLDEGITVFDTELRLIAWNQAFLRLLDFPATLAYAGAPFESFIRYNAQRGEYGHDDIEASIAERVEAARGFISHNLVRTRPDGRVLRVRGQPLPGHGFVTLYSDLTEQQRAEHRIHEQNLMLETRVAGRTSELRAINERLMQANSANEQIARSLRRSEEQMRLITDSIPALIAYFDRDRSYRYINRGYREWFGLDPAQPERISAREYLGAQVYAGIKHNVAQALAGEPVSFEYEITTISGRKLLARTTLIPDRTAAGEVAGCFELTFDITEQKRTQELLAQAQKLDALGQLTGGLAHDFNNILTVIIGNLSALCETVAGPADARLDAGLAERLLPDYVEPALDAARRGAELIRGLLTFARRQSLAPCAVDVGALSHTVERLVRRSLPEHLRLDVPAPPAPLWAMADAHQLENALLNLILNARDASPGGGVVSVSASAAELDEGAATERQVPAGSYVRIDVADTGQGMDAATLARVFEPFFTTKRPGAGTGLGMAMVYGFVRQSGGAVSIRSQPGQGTTVSLWLPRVAAPGALDQPDEEMTVANAGERGLALLVEDDAAVRRVVRRSLLALGYVVIEAADGVEASEMLATMPGIRLLLTDVVMPGGVDGRDLARRARERHQVPQVVLMSGYAPGEVQAPGITLLAKPFSKAQLAAVLAEGES